MRCAISATRCATFVLAVLLNCYADGAQFFFTTTPTLTAANASTAANTNPTLTLSGFAPSVPGELYLWVKLAPDDDTLAPTERINAMGVDVVKTGATSIRATQYVAYNTVGVSVGQRRWDSPAPASNNPVISGGESVGISPLASFRRGAVSRLGLQSPSGGDTEPATVVDASGNNYLRVADITLKVDLNPTQFSVPLFL